VIAVKPFLHYASRVGYGSATSTSNLSMAGVVVSSYFFFSFLYNYIVRIAISNVQSQHQKAFVFDGGIGMLSERGSRSSHGNDVSEQLFTHSVVDHFVWRSEQSFR
jgi:hypothetical protein